MFISVSPVPHNNDVRGDSHVFADRGPFELANSVPEKHKVLTSLDGYKKTGFRSHDTVNPSKNIPLTLNDMIVQEDKVVVQT